MPKVEFGQKTHFDGGGKTEYLELTVKDQKFHVRFLGAAIYDGKHFFQDEAGRWEVPYCARIMKKEPCEYCEKFFDAKRKMKEMRSELGEVDQMQGKDKAVYKELEATAKRYGVTTTFYYPVLNRETQEAGLLKCAPSIRWMLDEEHSNGIAILDFDYIVKRTEIPGKYYTLMRMDSAAVKPLTEKEQSEVGRASEWDLDSMVYGKQSSFDLEHDDMPDEGSNETARYDSLDIDDIINQMDEVENDK